MSENVDLFDSDLPNLGSIRKEKMMKMRLRKKKKQYLFYPEDYCKQHWDLFITLVLLTSCIITPY